MTFIATVIAKKGAALIADSLVTTSRQVLEFDDFYKYLQKKSSADGSGEIKIDPKEVINLFNSKPSHTKDYQEKLFTFDKYTAISTAGAAFLNDKSLEDIINEAKLLYNKAKIKRGIDEKLVFLDKHFNNEALSCLKKGNIVRDTVLIITQYIKTTHGTVVHKLFIKRSTPDNLSEEDYKCTWLLEQSNFSSVICEGQNRISEKILWGDLETIMVLMPNVAKKIFKDFGISEEKIPPDYVNNLALDKEILPAGFYDDIKMSKLSELSLQQAIDFACLLMRIERDIQKYTENIPTVGGNVKLGVIDDRGFRFISGDELRPGSF